MTVLLKTILFINLPEDTVDRIFIKTAKCKLFFALVVEIIPFKFLELSNRKKKGKDSFLLLTRCKKER